MDRYRKLLQVFDFAAFPKLSKSAVKQIDDVLGTEVPKLVQALGDHWK